MKNLIFTSLSILIIFLICLYCTKEETILNTPVWCDGKPLIDLSTDNNTLSYSQSVFDIFSFTHFSAGIIAYSICKFLKLSDEFSFYFTLSLALIFEIVENSPYVINKFKKTEQYKQYKGDSLANITGDIIALILGIKFYSHFKTLSFYYVVLAEILLRNYNASIYDFLYVLLLN